MSQEVETSVSDLTVDSDQSSKSCKKVCKKSWKQIALGVAVIVLLILVVVIMVIVLRKDSKGSKDSKDSNDSKPSLPVDGISPPNPSPSNFKRYEVSTSGQTNCSQSDCLVQASILAYSFNNYTERIVLNLTGYRIKPDSDRKLSLKLVDQDKVKLEYFCMISSDPEGKNGSYPDGAVMKRDGDRLNCSWELDSHGRVWPSICESGVDLITEKDLRIVLSSDSTEVEVAKNLTELPIYQMNFQRRLGDYYMAGNHLVLLSPILEPKAFRYNIQSFEKGLKRLKLIINCQNEKNTYSIDCDDSKDRSNFKMTLKRSADDFRCFGLFDLSFTRFPGFWYDLTNKNCEASVTSDDKSFAKLIYFNTTIN